jgi:hypothetical protein
MAFNLLDLTGTRQVILLCHNNEIKGARKLLSFLLSCFTAGSALGFCGDPTLEEGSQSGGKVSVIRGGVSSETHYLLGYNYCLQLAGFIIIHEPTLLWFHSQKNFSEFFNSLFSSSGASL